MPTKMFIFWLKCQKTTYCTFIIFPSTLKYLRATSSFLSRPLLRMTFAILPPFIWQFAAESDRRRGQGAEVSPRESNRGDNHTTCIIGCTVTSLSPPVPLFLYFYSQHSLLSPTSPSLLSTSHCLLLEPCGSLRPVIRDACWVNIITGLFNRSK